MTAITLKNTWVTLTVAAVILTFILGSMFLTALPTHAQWGWGEGAGTFNPFIQAAVLGTVLSPMFGAGGGTAAATPMTGPQLFLDAALLNRVLPPFGFI